MLLVATACAGCVEAGPGTHGETLKQYGGTVSMMFTNATSQAMCNLSMTADDSGSYGDNWLPDGGLPSGKSIEFHVKPGHYKATWNTCHHAGATDPYYAGTLMHERAFDVKDSVQLFAYVADTVAPTSRAALAAYHKVVRFEGMTIPADTGRVDERPDVAATPAAPVTVATRFDAKDWIDTKAAAAAAAKKKSAKIRPSLARTHDMANDAQVGYRAK